MQKQIHLPREKVSKIAKMGVREERALTHNATNSSQRPTVDAVDRRSRDAHGYGDCDHDRTVAKREPQPTSDDSDLPHGNKIPRYVVNRHDMIHVEGMSQT